MLCSVSVFVFCHRFVKCGLNSYHRNLRLVS